MLDLLKKYSPKHDKYFTLKNNLIDNVSKFYEKREKITEGFKMKYSHFVMIEKMKSKWSLKKKKKKKQ